MTYEEIVAYTKKKIADADVSGYQGHLAVQVNITGEGEGAFYVELNDKTAAVEPYEYFDRDAILIAPADVFKAIADGKKDAQEACQTGEAKVEGSLDKVKELGEVFKSKKKKAPIKKAAAKAPAKTTGKPAAKAVVKKAAEKVEKKAEKAPAKATAAAKTVAAKAAKTEEKAAEATKKAAETTKKAAVATAKKVVAKKESKTK